MKNINLSLALTVLTGCSTMKPTVFVREVPVTAVSTNNLDAIRFASVYHAYTVGRRIDPSNPKLMHDAHVIYLREQPDRWNLNPSASPMPHPAAPVDPAFKPLPLDEQLRLELQEQQRMTQTLKQQSERFQQAADLVVPATQKAAEVVNWLQERQNQLEERLRKLEPARTSSPTTLQLPPTNSNQPPTPSPDNR